MRTNAHHVEHWAHGGETSLDNLVQLCRHHHRLVHEGGFLVERRGDGHAFRRPDGSLLPGHPLPRSDRWSELCRKRGWQGVRWTPTRAGQGRGGRGWMPTSPSSRSPRCTSGATSPQSHRHPMPIGPSSLALRELLTIELVLTLRPSFRYRGAAGGRKDQLAEPRRLHPPRSSQPISSRPVQAKLILS